MTADSKIKIRQIEAFRCFMLSGSVTGAAELLCISQPAVSRLLSDLEYRLGFSLFIRTHNKIEATPEAHLFYRDVERVFVGMNSLAKAADAIARNNKGHLRLGVMPICSDSFLVDVIAAFCQQHPDVEIELESAPRVQLLDMVRARQVDSAIVTDIDPTDTEFNSRLLCRNRAVVVLPEGHPLAEKASLGPSDLAHERFMTLGYGSPFRTKVEEVFLRQRIKRHIVLEAREQNTLFKLVRKGVGIAVLDPFIVHQREGGVLIRPFEPVTEWDYFVVQAKDVVHPVVVEAFNTLLFEHLSA